MKPETKLWIRKRALMALRAMLWHADEWLHRQEVKLREEIQGGAGDKPVHRAIASNRPTVTDETAREKPRFGIVRRRRGKTAAEFDVSLASRSMPLRFSSAK